MSASFPLSGGFALPLQLTERGAAYPYSSSSFSFPFSFSVVIARDESLQVFALSEGRSRIQNGF
jgi:hypothetical protein